MNAINQVIIIEIGAVYAHCKTKRRRGNRKGGFPGGASLRQFFVLALSLGSTASSTPPTMVS